MRISVGGCADDLAEHGPPFPVDVRDGMLLVNRLDAGMSPLRDLRHHLRGPWIAEVDPASAGASGPRGAETTVLPWAIAAFDRGIDVLEPDPAPLLMEIDDDTMAMSVNPVHRRLKLLATIAP